MVDLEAIVKEPAEWYKQFQNVVTSMVELMPLITEESDELFACIQKNMRIMIRKKMSELKETNWNANAMSFRFHSVLTRPDDPVQVAQLPVPNVETLLFFLPLLNKGEFKEPETNPSLVLRDIFQNNRFLEKILTFAADELMQRIDRTPEKYLIKQDDGSFIPAKPLIVSNIFTYLIAHLMEFFTLYVAFFKMIEEVSTCELATPDTKNRCGVVIQMVENGFTALLHACLLKVASLTKLKFVPPQKEGSRNPFVLACTDVNLFSIITECEKNAQRTLMTAYNIFLTGVIKEIPENKITKFLRSDVTRQLYFKGRESSKK